ncbi:1-pyrroline-5-carboxylate dehydrogenase domain protein [Mycobacterium ulcerans str. Harvey]|uniref:1-pyrroline-5-carboxylate dehydrogenase domain protein n=1 Tax=Mycobacterium ulcerans str. Harvey TaxID=1299332 RepID=A0ABP3ALD3_MYCUL|nr:1-pyrroline-5-carboxylate dehydrogenase domain protein [Mycobacterium ulcerans str. Harvey]
MRPTALLSDDPTDESFATEYFGPVLSLHVYPTTSTNGSSMSSTPAPAMR